MGKSENEAVFFMKDHAVSRQMLFSEFEALIDGLSTIPEYVDEDARAVYAVIDPYGDIQALVFFKIYFDDEQNLMNPEKMQQIARHVESEVSIFNLKEENNIQKMTITFNQISVILGVIILGMMYMFEWIFGLNQQILQMVLYAVLFKFMVIMVMVLD